MSRKLLALAIVAASLTLGFATSEADAKSWRSRHRDHNCCYEQRYQERNCGHQHVNYRDCGHHQHYQQHVAVSTCCAPRPTCCVVQQSCAVPAAPLSCATPGGTINHAPAPPPIPAN